MLLSLRGALLTAVALFSVNSVALGPPAPKGLKFRGRAEQFEAQLEAAKQLRPVQRRSEGGGPGTVQNITFTNPLASEFYVDGSTIPLVNWDAGPSWAGLLPISSDPDETRKLFFWFFPPGPEGSLDDLILWLNGGPGCSSMDGLLQENGPISWQAGEAYPTPNEYSWTNLSSILWVDQPVGTGYSVGTPDVTNEDEVAAQLVGFFQQFLEVFSELKGKNFYLSGESYAGMYVPCEFP
ncbi:uncharacterized protein FIBRA_08855 [Fibroporia radiculosa]|uniref:Carboxypeptidase n=1 Tax=Fibroporia radiculosa TaxID=599839 RepID=J4I3F2_9APHY|nr:uncharacterized protein FIBRA_08855 [Fibroporia radiculosa]CCM06577.1 predicted protein [Fibroporia radiculosa]